MIFCLQYINSVSIFVHHYIRESQRKKPIFFKIFIVCIIVFKLFKSKLDTIVLNCKYFNV